MDGDRTFALVAIGRKTAQVDDLFVREQFARIRSVEKFVVVGKKRFDTGRMDEFQPNGTLAFVPKDGGHSRCPTERTRPSGGASGRNVWNRSWEPARVDGRGGRTVARDREQYGDRGAKGAFRPFRRGSARKPKPP